MMRNVVVVGASLAGLRAVESLRTEGFDGSITLIGAEPHLPYDRPPLSKKVLAGEWEPDRIALRRSDQIDLLQLDLRLGRRAERLDALDHVVELDDGSAVSYDGLVIATGAQPRRLPGQANLAGVVELRTLDDSLALRALLDDGPHRVVVVGAGFIGAEVAATARQRGAEVTIVEALPVPLARGLGPVMGAACGLLHDDNGVDLRLGVWVEAIEGGTRVERVRLSDGAVLAADVVVVGIGVVPAVGWLEGSGLTLRDGIVCDATLWTGLPGVYAAGDVARWPNARFGEEMRVEHWTNANEQGALAAKNLLASGGVDGSGISRVGPGAGEAYEPVPFFWSDQYGSRLQYLGRASSDDEVQVVHGSIDERAWVALYGRDGQLRGALGVNQPKLLAGYRKLFNDRASWQDALAHAARVNG